eukprot:gb/GECG01006625.1/.p1 GENE.gb/GECG01006625.1/~~gb/GECG01006625.1/.p1  ORF type:complete len:100 (+),score=12.74 gb/GECG01006625.1/:1-300(+)
MYLLVFCVGVYSPPLKYMWFICSQKESGLPHGSTALGILPAAIDTPMNRAGAPDADKSNWTPPEDIARKVEEWFFGERPASGSMFEPVTAGDTKWEERS